MAPRQRRMVDPDYAGQVRAGIGAKMNGQMTSSNSFKAFQTPMGGGMSNKQYSELIGRQRQADSATPGQRDKFDPQVSQNVLDFLGAGVNSSGNFEVNPAVLALNFAPVGRILGGLGKVATRVGRAEGVVGKLLAFEKAATPVGSRLGAAARAVQARAARQLREAEAARRVAQGVRNQGEDYIAVGRGNTGKIIRYEPGYVRNVQRGPFDEIVSDNIESVGTASGDSYSEAMRLVRMGAAKEVLDPKTGSRTWISVDPSGLAESGAKLLRESATASADAAASAARASTRVEQGTRYTKKALELRLRNYQKLSRQPGFGVKPPKPEPTVY